MRLRLRYLIPGIVVLGALLLGTRTNHVTLETHQQLDVKLDDLGQLDADLNQEVLEARCRYTTDYDSLVRTLESIHRTEADLLALSKAYPKSRRQSFRTQLQEFERLVAAKEQAIETFKSENAVLENSLRYLPFANADLLAKLRTDNENQGLEATLDQLIQRVYVHIVLRGDEEEAAIRLALSHLAKWRRLHPGHAQSSAVATVSAHVESICAASRWSRI